MSQKEENARKVTFLKDWRAYRKGDVAAMHKDLAAKVTKDKAGTVEKMDFAKIKASAERKGK